MSTQRKIIQGETEMAATIINQQLVAAISDCEVRQEELAKEQGKLVAAMSKFSKKFAAAQKRAANCKKYIASLLQEERIVEIRSDEKILTGPVAYTHLVRSESLNQYGNDYYYIVTMRRFCTCDGCAHTGRCKHVEALLDRLSEGEKKAKFAELKAQYDVRGMEQAREQAERAIAILEASTSEHRQEAVLAGASRGFSLYR